jgi:hypothetical protein
MFTIVSSEPLVSNALAAKAESNRMFQVAGPPAITPHNGSAASNRSGDFCTSWAVINPPCDTPHAIVRFGLPTAEVK